MALCKYRLEFCFVRFIYGFFSAHIERPWNLFQHEQEFWSVLLILLIITKNWSNYVRLVWNEKKKCSFCNMWILNIHVFCQCCSTVPLFKDDRLLKYVFFLYQKTFLPVWNHQWRVTFIYYASLHFCAFCLLECIVNNQRNKGTWMRNEVHRYRKWTGSALNTGVMFSFSGYTL